MAETLIASFQIAVAVAIILAVLIIAGILMEKSQQDLHDERNRALQAYNQALLDEDVGTIARAREHLQRLDRVEEAMHEDLGTWRMW
jgi:hypothetical protein